MLIEKRLDGFPYLYIGANKYIWKSEIVLEEFPFAWLLVYSKQWLKKLLKAICFSFKMKSFGLILAQPDLMVTGEKPLIGTGTWLEPLIRWQSLDMMQPAVHVGMDPLE